MPDYLKYLSFLCWHTQGKYQYLSRLDALKVYELGIIIKPFHFDIEEDEIQFILSLNEELGGLLNEQQVRNLKV